MPARLTQEEFIRRARAVHGDRYDYSHVVYKNLSTAVEIVCPKHGSVLVRPTVHLVGTGCPKCGIEGRFQACAKNHGGVHPFLTPESRAKAARTNLERYGSENPFGSKVIQEKIRQTNLERYGVENIASSAEIREKIRRINIERWGFPSSFQNPEVRAKHRATMLERYGVENSLQVPEVRVKAVETWRRKYGVDNPRKAPEIIARSKATCLERYGAEWEIASEAIRAKIRATMLERYGVENSMLVPEVRARVVATSLERYGCKNPMQSASVQAKYRETMLRRYGAEYPYQVPEIMRKLEHTKKMRGTFGSSVPEEEVYARIVEWFGIDNVIRQYKDPDYPFACDFYVVSRDLFIELNANWTHGGHWFDKSDPEDLKQLAFWKKKAESSEFYRNAISVWTDRDVRKREAARAAGLNYVVLWDRNLSDAELWFEAGFPDGEDWREPYSWLSI